ncbi:hypothetical protein VNI00_003785 [Paramarasmius palmivorus]|uniref:Uncharacterized protein n=1 Tax=Paramarasmius palmivorus TaxID=297713 RepID=A0AAW0DMI9_9AGAR
MLASLSSGQVSTFDPQPPLPVSMKWYPHGPALATGEPKADTVTCRPNQHFFLQSVTFQVEDELFQIPDAVFPASETFQTVYPTVLDENTPVLLEGCTKAQFEAFLTVILQPCSHLFSAKHPCNHPLSLEVLLPALELATKWEFHDLSHDIAYQAGRLITSPVQMIVLGRQYTVLSWYHPGLKKLVASDDDITLEEAETIGFPFALRVYHARARYARTMRDRLPEEDVAIMDEITKNMFADELSHFDVSPPDDAQMVGEIELEQTEVGQPDETDTETILVAATDDESFTVVTQQGQTDPDSEAHVDPEANAPDVVHLTIPGPESDEATHVTVNESECASGQTSSNTIVVADTTDSETETKRALLRAVVDPTWRSSPDMMSISRGDGCGKKKCKKFGVKCMRCYQAKAREKIGNPTAKTSFGQACLMHILREAGQPSSLEKTYAALSLRREIMFCECRNWISIDAKFGNLCPLHKDAPSTLASAQVNTVARRQNKEEMEVVTQEERASVGISSRCQYGVTVSVLARQNFNRQPTATSSRVFISVYHMSTYPKATGAESGIFRELYPAILERSTAIVLADCTKRHFEAFLTVILRPYSSLFASEHPCNRPLSLGTLLNALEISTKWGFHSLSRDIIDEAGGLINSAIQKVTLGQQYTILPWFKLGLEELVLDDTDITMEDSDTLGMALTLRVYHARARYGRSLAGINGLAVSDIVEDMFADDLALFDETDPHNYGDVDSNPETIVVTVADNEHDAGLIWPHTKTCIESTLTDSSPFVGNTRTEIDETPEQNFDEAPQVISAILDSTGTTRRSTTLLTIVPRRCCMTLCYDERCLECCRKKAKELQDVGKIPKAKTTLGQAYLNHLLRNYGLPSTDKYVDQFETLARMNSSVTATALAIGMMMLVAYRTVSARLLRHLHQLHTIHPRLSIKHTSESQESLFIQSSCFWRSHLLRPHGNCDSTSSESWHLPAPHHARCFNLKRPPNKMTRNLDILNETEDSVLDHKMKICTPNQHFYLRLSVFQVDDELFQIPENVFPASERFQELYPAILTANAPVVLQDSLDLATKWGFRQAATDISAQAGQFIASPVEKVALGSKYGVSSWYRPGLEDMVRTDEDITLDDAEKIGLAFTIRVYHARARYAREMRVIDLDGDGRSEGSIVTEIIELVFTDELAKYSPSAARLDVQPEHSGNSEGTQVVEREESELGTVFVSADESESNGGIISQVTSSAASPSSPEGTGISPSVQDSDVATEEESTSQPTPAPYINPASIEVQRIVIRAILDARFRTNVTILTKVPKVCYQVESRCGAEKRCRSCCIKEARRYDELGWMPQPKNAFGHVVLDMTVRNAGTEGEGFPTSSREVLRHVPKTCERREQQCGSSVRCVQCFSDKVEELVKHGKII